VEVPVSDQPFIDVVAYEAEHLRAKKKRDIVWRDYTIDDADLSNAPGKSWSNQRVGRTRFELKELTDPAADDILIVSLLQLHYPDFLLSVLHGAGFTPGLTLQPRCRADCMMVYCWVETVP
jgi:hypothetical protein